MNLCPEFSDTVAILCEPGVEVLEGSLASSVYLLTGVKRVVVLVDGIVGQMHEVLVLWGEKGEGGGKGERGRRGWEGGEERGERR